MFTGLVTDIGEIKQAGQGQYRIACGYDAASIAIGASIACDGCCLTVTEVDRHGVDDSLFTVEVSNETLARTTLGRWSPGVAVNLERSLKIGDELGGHLVTGHVDAAVEILRVIPDGNSKRFEIACPESLGRFVAPKGSVALDGTSLTVNEVEGSSFTVNIIPYTLQVTTWGQKRAGDALNMEVDLMARYAARLSEYDRADA